MTYKIILVLSFLNIGFSTSLRSQHYNKTPISIPEIKRGISDFEYLRAVFLEKGFTFDGKDSNSEFWNLPVEDETKKSLFKQIAIQVSTWKYEGTPVSKTIYFQIRKDLLPGYTENFISQMNAAFPEKKAKAVKQNDGGADEKNYVLIYYSKQSDIIVEFEEDDKWVKCSFELDLKKR